MFVKVESTRHTAVGTFRFGVVYKIDPTDHKIQRHVLPLLEGEAPAIFELDEDQALEAGTPTQFTPEATGAAVAGDNLADMRDKLEASDAVLKDLQAAMADATAEIKDLTGKLSEAEDSLADALTAAAKAEERADSADAGLVEANKRADEAEARANAAEAALTAPDPESA